ncbi:MAG: SUMF1/EgtB/PvdO family nonheme iron enzyme [Phycisphaerae bacterium]|nr:SUMF1/EgtB/PvdO family nonheme iron enzyme [Gemmatimonadaceae bacterium]
MDTRSELQRVRAHSDALFKLVSRETLYERPIPDRHRLIFYVGHLEAFDWNQLARTIHGMASFDTDFDRLFEAGIDPVPGQAASDEASDWPRLEAVLQYVARTRSAIDEIWEQLPSDRRQMVIEHRWMHAETLCYLLFQLAPELKRRPAVANSVNAPAQAQRFVSIPAGTAHLGQIDGSFGWDNEFPEHRQSVEAFEIAQHKVTNAEYLRFVEAGGAAPLMWRQRNGVWWVRRMFDEVPLPLTAPVYATHQQARAYALWAGADLPSEAQWHRAAYGDSDRRFPWGNALPHGEHGNFDFADWDPVGVTAFEAGDSAYGVSQMMGNGWEWTSTPFGPFEGFKAHSYYPGYSSNFFDDDHYVLKGASPVTSRTLLRRSFRNWFRADYPYVYSTIRLVRPAN